MTNRHETRIRIEKLLAITVSRGATVHEADTAQTKAASLAKQHGFAIWNGRVQDTNTYGTYKPRYDSVKKYVVSIEEWVENAKRRGWILVETFTGKYVNFTKYTFEKKFGSGVNTLVIYRDPYSIEFFIGGESGTLFSEGTSFSEFIRAI